MLSRLMVKLVPFSKIIIFNSKRYLLLLWQVIIVIGQIDSPCSTYCLLKGNFHQFLRGGEVKLW